MRSLVHRVALLVDLLLPATLGAMAGLAAVETLAWTFFEISWPWLSEIVGLLLVTFAILGAAQGVHLGSHLGVEFLTRRLPTSWQRFFDRLSTLAVGLCGLLLAIYGAGVAQRVGNTLPATGLSAAWQYLPVAVGGSLIAFFALARLFEPASIHEPMASAAEGDVSTQDAESSR